MALELTPEGIIKSGRYAGHHIDELADFAESLENAGLEAKPAPAGGEKKPEAKPGDATLAERSGARLTAVQDLTVSTAVRLEQDDEEAFAATVPDYEKYREQIAKAKKSLTPQQRTFRGLHKNMYLGARMQEKDVQDRILGVQPVAQADGDGGEAEPEAEVEAPVKEEAKPAPKLEQIKPKAVAPISAKPTPVGREKHEERKAKLKDTNGKLARVASAMGMGLAQYLLQLEDRGVTQDTLDKETQTRTEGAGATRRSKVYGG